MPRKKKEQVEQVKVEKPVVQHVSHRSTEEIEKARQEREVLDINNPKHANKTRNELLGL